MPEIKTSLTVDDQLTPGMQRAASGIDKEARKMEKSAKKVNDSFGQLAKQVLTMEMMRRAAIGLAQTLKHAEGYSEMAKTAKTATENFASSIGRSLMPTVNDLMKGFGELSKSADVVGQAIGGAFAAIVASIKTVAVVLYKDLELVMTAFEGGVKLLDKIPKRFVPDSWEGGIKGMIEGTDQLRKTFKIAGEDMAKDAGESWGKVGKIFSGEIKAGAVKKGGVKGGEVGEEKKGDEAAKQLEVSTAAFAEAQAASLENIVDMRIDMMDEGRKKEWALIEWNQQKEIAALEEKHSIMLTSEEVFQAERKAILDKYDGQKAAAGKKLGEEEIAREKKVSESKYQAASGFFGGFAALLQVAGKKSKEAAIAAKAMAITQTIIDTAVSAVKAFKSMLDVGPAGPALGAIAAAGAIAFGVAQIATISAAKFERGGVVAGTAYSGDRMTARVNSGEMILNQQQQAELFAVANGKASGSASVSVGGDTIIINGNADSSTVRAIQKTREDQLNDLRGMMKELQYRGRLV